MSALRPPNPLIAGLVPYDPKYLPARVQVSANESTEDVPVGVRRAAEARLAAVDLNRYPDALCGELRAALAAWHGLPAECVLVGNGGDELLFDVALARANTGVLVNIPPTFGSLPYDCALLGTPVVDVPRGQDFEFPAEEVLARASRPDVGIVLVTSPNNPTGDQVPLAFIDQLCAATAGLVLVDEAYIEFAAPGTSAEPLLARHGNLAVLHTLSKLYSLAAARIGYVLAAPEVIAQLAVVRQPYSVSALDQAVALACVEMRGSYELRQVRTVAQRDRLSRELSGLPGVQVFPSQANFLLVRFDEGIDAGGIWQQLLDRGILVRDFSSGELTRNCLRVSVGTAAENDQVIAALRDLLAGA